MNRLLRVLILLSLPCALSGQSLSLGLKLGAPINYPSRLSGFSSGSQSRWSGGPFVELLLPYRLSVEFSALYRTSRETAATALRLGESQNPYLVTSADKVRTWDFPLLLKYRFTGGTVRPFAGAGAGWSHRRSDFQTLYSCLGSQGSCTPEGFPGDLFAGSQKSTLTRFAPAASAGFDITAEKLTISPEVRWNRSFSGASTGNQYSVMVSFSFGR